jgi:hypothetical protein
MKSEDYVALQFDLKEHQDFIEGLDRVIELLEEKVGENNATALRRYRDTWIKKAKAIQDKLDYEQMELGL